MLFNKSISIAILGFLVISGISSRQLHAQAQMQLNVQGVISDVNGVLLDGVFSMKFSIYDTSTGGNELWSESHDEVFVMNGLFNVFLGNTNSFVTNPSIFSQYSLLYLGIAVENEPEFERVQLSAVPYSFYAEEANRAKSCTALIGAASDLNCTGCVGAIDITSNSINSGHIVNGTIKDDDISSTAKISFTKLSGVAALDHTHPEYAPITHKHNDLYYQKSEINTLLLGKSDTWHNHDGSYYTKSELSEAGTINSPTNPVDWTKLKNVPDQLASNYIFGNWTKVNFNQVYHTVKDGFVVGFTCHNSSYTAEAYTDAYTPPATLRLKSGNMASGCWSLNMPVKKNHYYKVTYSASSESSLYFLPIF